MNILLIGNGAREHAIAEAIVNSPQKPRLFSYMKSNNPGIAALSEQVQIGKYDDLEEIENFAGSSAAEFAVIGPEDPLQNGVVDALERMGIPCIGPKKELAKLETSKSFTRLLMKKYKIPGLPKFGVFESIDGIMEFLEKLDKVVIKPDGLTGGKGVKVQGDHFKTKDEAYKYCEEVLKEHSAVVIEEKLEGEEFSLQSFTDGKTIFDCPPVQDHKRAFVDDKGPNCYSSDTEILSEKGWKTFDKLKKGEKVMTFDLRKYALEFKKPMKIYWMNHDGKMVHFKHRELDLLVTPNHSILVKNRKTKKLDVLKAENFIGEKNILLSGNWKGKSPKFFFLDEFDYKFNRKLKKQRINFVDWIRFMGLFLSEGYIINTKKEHRVIICQTKKSKYFDKFKSILSKLPFKFSYDEKRAKFRINSIQLTQILKKYGTSRQKYIPGYIKDAKKEHIINFLKTFMWGDGSIHQGRMRFHSSSKRLMDDIQELVLKIGKSGIITTDKRTIMLNPINKKYYQANPAYSLEIKPEIEVGIRKKDVSEIDYDGHVGCVTVPTSFVVVRRNNRVAIAGNTGGMGSYSTGKLLPFMKQEDLEQAHIITDKVREAIFKECGELYKGVMYGGFICTKDGVKLIEYNARMGDPETMNVLPIMKNDFVAVCKAIIDGTLHKIRPDFKDEATVCKYAVPQGYPTSPVKGKKISLGDVPNNVKVYYASVDKKEDGLYMTGSRAVAFVGIAPTLEEAEVIAEDGVCSAQGPIFHREDIGTEELIEKRVGHMEEIKS